MEPVIILADVFSKRQVADAEMYCRVKAVDVTVVTVIMFAEAIIADAAVTMLHPSLILAETTADVTETKDNAGGHRYFYAFPFTRI